MCPIIKLIYLIQFCFNVNLKFNLLVVFGILYHVEFLIPTKEHLKQNILNINILHFIDNHNVHY